MEAQLHSTPPMVWRLPEYMSPSLTLQPKMKTIFVYCKGSPELLSERIAARKNHFMKPQMLASQLATLEDPSAERGVVTVDISASPEEVSRRAVDGVRRVVGEMDSEGL